LTVGGPALQLQVFADDFEEFIVDEAIRKARVLVEALGWIRQFRGRYVVIKLGGSTLEDSDKVRAFLTDVLFLETVGMKPILIHGGGKDISRAMEEAGIEPRWVHGRRYTDKATLEIASRVLAEQICDGLVAELKQQGGDAVELSFRTANCLVGEKLTLPSDEGEMDLGFVGQVVDIDADLLARETEAKRIPVLPCVATDRNGQLLNVNGDTAAAAVARLLKAEKLVFVSDVPGIMRDPADPGTLISHITVSQCRGLIADGTIASGMVPKVEAALEAIEAGVGKLHIVDGRIAHSVLLEIYSDQGIGTEIVA
jgi:acetylglutamate kinase